jgi:cyclopropane-fatty-acyl-phospholipid synthase
MRMIRRCLAPEGLFLLHTIAGNRSVRPCDPWISRYIFPNSMLPSSRQISSACRKTAGPGRLAQLRAGYYDPTLLAWYQNFKANWERIKRCL